MNEFTRRLQGVGYYYDEDGNEISVEEWTAIFGEPRWQLVDEQEGVKVSTVFLGLNHQFDPDLPPLIYESMVWVDGEEVDQFRYPNKANAEAGHGILWRRYRKKSEWTIGERITPIG
jgi:hypothetical protein